MSSIMKLMQAMGYKDLNQIGVCFGLAQGLIQAHLSGEKDWVEIHKMLASGHYYINTLLGVDAPFPRNGKRSLYEDSGAIKAAEERKRVIGVYENLCKEQDIEKIKGLLMSLDFGSGEEVNQEKIEAIKQKLNTEIEEWKSFPLSKECGLPEEFTDERLSKVRAFLETVYMYQEGSLKERELSGIYHVTQYSHSDLYIDKLLEEEKSKVSRVYCHDKNTFTKLMRLMQDIKGPVGFEIRLIGHTMGLVYNGNEHWTLVNHDTLIESSIKDIAEDLFVGLRNSEREHGYCESYSDLTYIYGLVAYTKPEKVAYGSNESQIEKCKKIMDGVKVCSYDEITKRLKSSGFLLRAAQEGDMRAIEECIKANFDINKESEIGESALMFACANGNVETAKLLIDNGAQVDKENQLRKTALTLACEKGYVKTAKLLIDKGADVNKDTNLDEFKKGWTALMLACERGYVKTAKLLIDSGAQVDKQNIDGETALILACEKGYLKTAKLLIGKGVNVDKENTAGETALMLAACKRGYVKTAKILIDKGADVDKQNKDGRTALMYTMKWDRHYEIAKILMDKGANLYVKDRTGKTVYDMADEKIKKEVLDRIRNDLDRCKEILKGLSESKDWSEEFKKEIDTAQDKSKGAKSLSEIGNVVTITSDLQKKAQREVEILENSIELELIGEKNEQRHGRLNKLHEAVLEKKDEIEDQKKAVMKQGDEVSPLGGNNHTEKDGKNIKKDETGAGTVSKKRK